MNIPRWAIYSKHDGERVCTISATSQDSAWRKFCTQHFGPLKPCRDDYGLCRTVYRQPITKEGEIV